MRRSIPVAMALLSAAGCTGGFGDSASNGRRRQAGPHAGDGRDGRGHSAARAAKPKGAADPALRAFYEQRISWRACKDDPKTKKKDESEFRCGTFKVPLDYTAPDGRSLDIAVMQHPAAKPDQRIGSLVLNPGGPGGSGQDFVKYGFDEFDGPLHDRYDILGFDPRGVADSAPVRCLDDKARDERNARERPAIRSNARRTASAAARSSPPRVRPSPRVVAVRGHPQRGSGHGRPAWRGR